MNSAKLGHFLLPSLNSSGKQQLEDQLKPANLELAKLSETLKQTEAAATSTHAQLESTQLELETVNQEMQFIERDLHR